MPITSRRRSTFSADGRRIGQVEQLAAERGERRQPGHRPRQVKDRGRRHVPVLGSHRPGNGCHAACLRLPSDGGEQPGLADPGLAGEQEELAPASDDVVEPPIGEDEQVVTPDEERTTDGSGCGTHLG